MYCAAFLLPAPAKKTPLDIAGFKPAFAFVASLL
jgi:hypothetical protein